MKRIEKVRTWLIIIQFVFLGEFVYHGIIYYKTKMEYNRLSNLKEEYLELEKEIKEYDELKNSYLLISDEGKKLKIDSTVLVNKVNQLNKEIEDIQEKIKDVQGKIDKIS